MTSSFSVLIDSDAFVGRFYPNDAHHQSTLNLFSQLERMHESLVTTSFVVAETATVLSHRSGQNLARRFLEVIEQGNFSVIHVSETLHQQALDLFMTQTQRGTSVTDCANVIVLRQFAIPELFSFDKFYQRVGIKLLTEQST